MKPDIGRFLGKIVRPLERSVNKLMAPDKEELEWSRRVLGSETPSEADIASYVRRRRAAINFTEGYLGRVQLDIMNPPLAQAPDFLGIKEERAMLDRNDPAEIVPAAKREAQDIEKRATPHR